jgi:hypothetical protein
MMAHGFLSPDTTHSDVELASAEGEMLYAHKHILAAHSPVNLSNQITLTHLSEIRKQILH